MFSFFSQRGAETFASNSVSLGRSDPCIYISKYHLKREGVVCDGMFGFYGWNLHDSNLLKVFCLRNEPGVGELDEVCGARPGSQPGVGFI